MLLHNSVDTDPRNKDLKSIYVYEAPVRLWHWVMFLAVSVLIVTGLLIAYPPPSTNGEASAHFMFGYIRFAHFAAGYTLAVSWLLRVYWAFVGNDYARQLFLVPIFNRIWWREFLYDIKSYSFMHVREIKYSGHNPMAQAAMAFMLVPVSIFMMVTGFALYSEGAGKGSWADRLFGWVIPLFGQSQTVHTWHHLGMWLMVTFVIVHFYMVIRQDVTTRESILSTMISGYRTFKD
jgi:Ni/Fe-hydrogenase 1 B-type cytochrome subunit